MNKKYLLTAVLSLGLLGSFNNLYSSDAVADKESSEATMTPFKFDQNGYSKWKAATVEAAVETKQDGETSIMVFKVKVDHTKNSSGTTTGKYLKGWPRIVLEFKPWLALSKYKELIFDYKIVTLNNKRAKTAIYVYLASEKVACTYPFDIGKKDDQWHTKVIALKDIYTRSNKSEEDWQNLKILQFGLAEENYDDKAELAVEIKNLQLQ